MDEFWEMYGGHIQPDSSMEASQYVVVEKFKDFLHSSYEGRERSEEEEAGEDESGNNILIHRD